MDVCWTDEIIERLKSQLEEGLTSTEIARCIPGATRNAVIGKIHRLGLIFPGRPPARPRRSGVKPRRAPPPRGVEVTAPKGELRAGTTLLDLRRHHCRWPVSDNPTLFCGNQRCDEITPYCAAHARIAYVGPPGRELRRGRNRGSVRDGSEAWLKE